MKFPTYLVVVLLVLLFINFAAAQRKTLWLLVDEQIMSVTNNYQVCARIASSKFGILLTTNNYVKIEATGDNQIGFSGNYPYITFKKFVKITVFISNLR